ALGPRGYMAPEQCGGTVDFRADLFALGCVLYELTTGRAPFEADSPLGVMANLARSQPPPPHTLNSLVSPALSALVLELLAKKPEERPASARAVALRLRALAAGGGGAGENPRPPPLAPRRGPRRRAGGGGGG